jgi:hypothetical protein
MLRISFGFAIDTAPFPWPRRHFAGHPINASQVIANDNIYQSFISIKQKDVRRLPAPMYRKESSSRRFGKPLAPASA